MNAPTSIPVMTGLTWQQFLDLPEEYRHASLIDGELFVTAPALLHQVVVTELLTALNVWIKAGEGRGKVSPEPPVQITHDRGYMPDIAWWRQEKCSPPGSPPAVDGPPDLVVEVLSPSTRRNDVIRKRNDFPTVGVDELWFIDPDEPSASVIRCGSGPQTVIELDAADALTSPELPGFTITVRDLITW